MAKKKNNNNTNKSARQYSENMQLVKTCAYIAMVVAAVAAILAFIFGLLSACGVHIDWAGRVVGICNTIAQIALIVAVVIPAYYFMRSHNNHKTGPVIKAFFWVAIIFLVCGLVGVNLAF